jgi:hypothetical protein
MRQSRSRFQNPQQRRVYEDYRTSGRDPLRPGGDGLAAAFHRGFLYPDRTIYDKQSLAHAAFAAGRDLHRDCREAIRAAGIETFEDTDGEGWHWKTPGHNTDDSAYRESEFPMTSEAAALWDAYQHRAEVIGAGPAPEDVADKALWAKERLRQSIKPGAIIYSVRRHMSRNNHRHEISLFATHIELPKGWPLESPYAVIDDITPMVALALQETRGPSGGIDVANVGADTGQQLVYRLGSALYPDSRPHGEGTQPFKHERL